MKDVAIPPIRYASVSGGKDSLLMLQLILANPEKYPLDCVVHFELEIDLPFVKKVVSRMEEMCSSLGIRFIRIKPEHSFLELYQKYGQPPNKIKRWCNSDYKLDCKRQLNRWIRDQRCRPTAYIGFCSDEAKRFRVNVGGWNPNEYQDECYPLAEEGIEEKDVLEWAKTMDIFEGHYKTNTRQSCWLCPLSSFDGTVSLLVNHRPLFDVYVCMLELHEMKWGKPLKHLPWPEYIKSLVVRHLPEGVEPGAPDVTRSVGMLEKLFAPTADTKAHLLDIITQKIPELLEEFLKLPRSFRKSRSRIDGTVNPGRLGGKHAK